MVSRCTEIHLQIKSFTTPCMTCVGYARVGLSINGKIVDTMIASALVDENQMRYDLNNCAKRYTGKTKNESDLYQAAKRLGG